MKFTLTRVIGSDRVGSGREGEPKPNPKSQVVLSGEIQEIKKDLAHRKKAIGELKKENEKRRNEAVTAEQIQVIVEAAVQRAVLGVQEFVTGQLMLLAHRVMELDNLGGTPEQK